MRRKPQQNNNYGQKRRNHQGRHGQPRKNYGAAREKYLSQARDAMSSGDRVMAEYYYQHAEHCFRMMEEEGFRPQHQQQHRPQHPHQGQHNPQQQYGEGQDDMMDDHMSEGRDADQLPAFITSGHTPAASDEPMPKAIGDAENN